jgi:hypothetical protein
MSKWEVGPVDALPTKTLDAWRVCIVPADGQDRPRTGHLWGFVRETCRGRVSTAIARLDPVSRRVLTRSGRVYHLAGNSGVNTDALLVWGAWKQARGIQVEDEFDATDEVEAALSRPR